MRVNPTLALTSHGPRVKLNIEVVVFAGWGVGFQASSGPQVKSKQEVAKKIQMTS
jgi:hypothetical protein